MAQQPPVGHGVLIIEASPSHSWHTTLGRTSLDGWSARRRDLWQRTTLTTDRHTYYRWDSNPQSQQASGRRPTP